MGSGKVNAEQLYVEMNRRWIGYQAKFFDDRTDMIRYYILYSAEKTVEYCAGKVFIICV